MPTPFITVSLILAALKNERGTTARLQESVRFLDWKEGCIIKSKGLNTAWRIEKIETVLSEPVLSESPTTGMTYQSRVTLQSTDDPEESRVLRGATLQQGYEFVATGVAEEDTKKDLKPMTIAVDCIRTFAPRKQGMPGSRIVLKDGTSYAVVEDHDELLSRINGPLAAAARHTIPGVYQDSVGRV